MATTELSVEVGAKITALRQALERDAPAVLKKFDAFVKNTGTNTLPAFAKGSNQAAFALQNLGRVAQDAPFGFIGIQNNLNPLLESFQQLKQQTGSTSAALKVMGQTLRGPAGLGVALSVVTAGLLLYQMWQRKANKETKEAVDANEEYRKSLKGVASAQLEGTAAAQKDLTQLKLLFNAYTDNSLSIKARKSAYEQLQQLYPKYFKDLKFEKEASEATATAYKSLTLAILASAKARASEGLIAKNSETQLVNSERILKLTDEITKLQSRRAALETQGMGDAEDSFYLIGQRKAILSEENKLISERSKLVTENNTLTVANLNLEKNVNKELEKGGTLTGKIGEEAKGSAEKIKSISDILKELSIDLKQADNNISGTFGDINKEKVNAYQKAIDDLTKLGTKPATEQIKKLKEAADEFASAEMKVKFPKDQEIGRNVPFLSAIEKAKYSAKDLIRETAEGGKEIGHVWESAFAGVLPKLQTNFEHFFNTILENGKFSFQELGKAILNTFTSVIASEAAQSLFSLINGGTAVGGKEQKGGLLKGIGGLLGIGGKVAGGGALLPILAGATAAIGLGSLLFKRRDRGTAPPPISGNPVSQSSGGGASQVVTVQGVVRGRDLVFMLNLEGYYLSRVQQNGRRV